jgi:hypothetical protein
MRWHTLRTISASEETDGCVGSVPRMRTRMRWHTLRTIGASEETDGCVGSMPPLRAELTSLLGLY